MSRFVRPMLVGAAFALACASAGSTEAQAAFRGHNGRIAFGYSSSLSGDNPNSSEKSIDDASPAGGRRRFLIGCTELEGQPDRGDCSLSYLSPAYSADGQSIVFDSGGVLAVMHADGTGFRRLPKLTDGDTQPAWSPGGSRIVFTGQHGTGSRATSDLYTVDPLGGHLTRLTYRGGSEGAWSAKGQIAFERRYNLYTITASGHELHKLTYRGGHEPDWSPHGTKLAFSRALRTGQPQAFIVNATGHGLRQLNTDRINAESPAWAPDGRFIATYAFAQGIYITPINNRKPPRQVSEGADGGDYFFDSAQPTWQPRH